MWLSGLHIPESYLTALVQATCRKNGWPLDKSTLYTAVTEVHRNYYNTYYLGFSLSLFSIPIQIRLLNELHLDVILLGCI